MKARSFFNTTTVTIAIVVIIFSTAALSFLSYTYTVGRLSIADEIQKRTAKALTDLCVNTIEQKIFANDRILAGSIDVNDPSKWDAEKRTRSRATRN